MQMAEQRQTRKVKDEIVKNETLVNSMGNFLKACHDGDRAAVERQLRQNAEVIHERDSLKNNCLYWTIVSGNLELFKYLLDQKAEFDNVNEEKENLLHVACKLGRSQFIKPLLFKCANDELAVCNAKKIPLERVAENGDLDCLKEFLKYGVQIIPSSLLPLAAGNKRIHFIRYLLDESGKSIDVDSQDKDGFTAFTKSCDNGANEIFQYLLKKGAKTNIPDKRRRGPLYYAAKSGHVDLVQSLILLGSDVNIQDKYTGSEACFLVHGKDKGRDTWHYVEVRRNVVHIFTKKTRSGQLDVAQYGSVIKSGCGQDPEQGINDWINKMYDDRAERPNAPGDMSPLHVAIYREHREVAAFLIENGADINLKDLFGITPYMYCALRNDLVTATLLATKGANLNERDNEGFTALEIAKMNEHPEMINYIEGINDMGTVQKFVEGGVRACERNLSTRRIEELRQKGEDVKRHTIDELRNLQLDVNCLLLDLGSGPVMKPTEDAETEATMDTAEAVAAPENSDEHILPSTILCMATAYGHPTPTVEIASGCVEMRTEDINYMDPVQKFLERAVRACARNLSTRRIEELRNKGEDVKRHAIDELRNLQIKINCLLLELGSFPLMISMEDTETDATVDTDSDDTDEDTCLSAIAPAYYHHTSRGL